MGPGAFVEKSVT